MAKHPTKTGEREKIAVWLEHDQLKALRALLERDGNYRQLNVITRYIRFMRAGRPSCWVLLPCFVERLICVQELPLRCALSLRLFLS